CKRVDLVDRPPEGEHRIVGAEQHLPAAVAVEVVNEARGPVLRTVCVGSDEYVLVLPGHGDHLIMPGNADMNSDELQFRKIAGDVVEQNRTRDAAQGTLLVIDKGL